MKTSVLTTTLIFSTLLVSVASAQNFGRRGRIFRGAMSGGSLRLGSVQLGSGRLGSGRLGSGHGPHVIGSRHGSGRGCTDPIHPSVQSHVGVINVSWPVIRQSQTLNLVGTWQSSDRILTVLAGKRFRVYWRDQGRVRADMGSYTVHGRQVHFQADRGPLWIWQLHSLSNGRLTLSHAEVGTRHFRRIPAATGGLAGNYIAHYSKNQTVQGNAEVYLFEDGVYVINEFKPNGQLDHSELGSWTAGGNHFTFNVHFQGRSQSVPARLQMLHNGFQIQFVSLLGDSYTYVCRRAG